MASQALVIDLNSDKNEVVQQIKAVDPSVALEWLKAAGAAAAVAFQVYSALQKEPQALVGGVQTSILNFFGGMIGDKLKDLVLKWASDPDIQKAIFDKVVEIIQSFFKK